MRKISKLSNFELFDRWTDKKDIRGQNPRLWEILTGILHCFLTFYSQINCLINGENYCLFSKIVQTNKTKTIRDDKHH